MAARFPTQPLMEAAMTESAPTESPVLSASENGVTTLTINRPQKLNALDRDVIGALESAFQAAADDPATRVVVLTGAGPKAFVAGADIGELRDLGDDQARAFVERGLALMARIENLGKPVIAAINGFALGGGCELALACTMRIAADTARLGLPEVKLGLIPGYGGTQRLARLIGRGRALHLMLTGDPVTAEAALAQGLVTAVVPADELTAHVAGLAKSLAAGAPLAMAAIMDSVNTGADLPLADGLAVETDRFVAVCGSEDMREGTAAFLEKRRADFKGA